MTKHHTGSMTPQAQQMIARSANIPKKDAKRVSFRRFWRKFKKPELTRQWQRFIALEAWRAQVKTQEETWTAENS